MRYAAYFCKYTDRARRFAFVLACILYLSGTGATAQVTATLRADSNKILIGDPLKIRLSVSHPATIKVPFPAVADTLGNLETISVAKVDTAADGDKTVLSQVYTVSAYDSGEYHAGPVKIYFANSNGELDSALSNDIIVTVNTLDVDTAKPFKAIKAPLEVPYTWQEFIYYIIAGLLLIIAIVVAILLWKKYKKKKPVVVERPKPKDPAHIWARRELKKLEEEKLWQKNETKLYYSRLTDILRYYLEFHYGWYAMESTTEEIEEEMGNYKLKEKAKENLLAILRAADLVKFAKMIPLPDANMKAMENAYKFIDFTEPAENRVEKK